MNLLGNMRRLAENAVRNRVFRRRMPADFGRRPIWVSPDARLRYLKPGRAGFESSLLAFAKRFIFPGAKVLDIGGNVGEFALAAAHRAGTGGQVVTVEPDPFLGSLILRTSAEKANRDLSMRLLSAAVSNQQGISCFFISARGRASNALASSGTEDMGGVRQEYLVPVLKLDDIVAEMEGVDVIKIDVEGAEWLVLQGAEDTLDKLRPIILMEVRKNKNDIFRLLKKKRFLMFDIEDLSLSTSLDQCHFDTIAVAEEKLSEIRSFHP